MATRLPRRLLAAAFVAATAALLIGVSLGTAGSGAYTVTPLVSDGSIPAPNTDPNLVNAWGLTAGPTTPWWVADNGKDVTTLYPGTGVPVGLVVSIPIAPTGAGFNGDASSFPVMNGTATGPARFIFDTEEGQIRGWNPNVPPPPTSTQTEVGVDSSPAGAIYKGLAIIQFHVGSRLYAADFHNARIDVFDGSWMPVVKPGAFVDPNLPKGYAPFNVQTIGSRIFVAYAKQDADAKDEVAGQGFGFVDVYDVDGKLLARVASRGQLNAPWGLALAPAHFGQFSGDLLVGNFGNGEINAYEELPDGSWVHRGKLRDADGHVILIEGLWALQFGNDAAAGPKNTLFFTAGPHGETEGLFGSITAG